MFQVFPESAAIKARGTAKFTVTFRPLRSGRYFYQLAQYFAIRYNEKMNLQKLERFERKQHKLVEDVSVTRNIKLTQTLTQKISEEVAMSEMIPPFEGHLVVMGHTFKVTSMPFIPMVEVLPCPRISFVPCSPGQSIYQTVQLVNRADTHTYFSIGEDSQRTFRAYPSRGLIESQGFALLHLEFCPQEPRLYCSAIVLHFNYAQGSQRLELAGLCSQPTFQLEDEGRLLFPPNHMGVMSRRTVRVKNMSRLQASCESKIPEKYREEVYIDPPFKILQPLETTLLEVAFVPYHKKKYKIKVPLIVEEVLDREQELAGYWKPGSINLPATEPAKTEYLVEILGSGGDGCLAL